MKNQITVLDAIKSLSGVCDGAGFNKPDSNLKEYAYYSDLTERQQENFLPILKKYEKTQLGAEVVIEKSEKLNKSIQYEQKIVDRKHIKKSVRFEDGNAVIGFKYNEELKDDIKDIFHYKIREFDWNTKSWSIQIKEKTVESIQQFLDDWFFKYNKKDLLKFVIHEDTEKIVLKEKNTILVYFDYSVEYLAQVKKIKGRKFKKEYPAWEVEINETNVGQVVEFIKNNSEFVVSESVKNIIRKFHKKAKELKKQRKQNKGLSSQEVASVGFKIKEGLNGTLRPFQLAGVEYIIKNKDVILGDDMGLGKSIQSIAAVHHTNTFPCLIVCPDSVKYNWRKEWLKWTNGKTVTVVESKDIVGKVGNSTCTVEGDVMIMNYSTLTKYFKVKVTNRITDKGKKKKEYINLPVINLVNFNSIILDEVHYCKNYISQRTTSATRLTQETKPKLVLGLSGTIIVNRPKELISPLTIINKISEFGGFWEFATRYCAATRTEFGLDMNGASNLPELHEKLREICYVRRNKEDVLKELPPMQIQNIEVDITNRREYNKAEKDLINYLKNEIEVNKDFLEEISQLSLKEQKEAKKYWHQQKVENAEAAEHLVRINLLKQIIGEGKIKAAIEFISNIIVNEKLVVFTTSRKTINTLQEHFKCKKIDGSVKSENRQKAIDDFQENTKTKLILVNLAAGREGITLTAASKLLLLEQGWTPGEHDQAFSRVHRISQTDAVNIYKMIARGTYDVDIDELISAKSSITEIVNSGREYKSVKTKSILSELIKRMVK